MVTVDTMWQTSKNQNQKRGADIEGAAALGLGQDKTVEENASV